MVMIYEGGSRAGIHGRRELRRRCAEGGKAGAGAEGSPPRLWSFVRLQMQTWRVAGCVVCSDVEEDY